MESIRRFGGTTAAAAALALLLAPTATLAELAKWNQERVTQIAVEFADAVKELQRQVKAAPVTTDPTRQRARYVTIDDVRIISNSATLLANKLKAGEGREQTFAVWRRLDLLRRDFEENARKSDIEDAIMAKIIKAGELLIRLTPYYSEKGEAKTGG